MLKLFLQDHMPKKKKVLIGMSGGVDSSVAAAMLKAQGYDCVGFYLNLWADPAQFTSEDSKKFPQNKCCSVASLMFARQIAKKLGMPFYSLNLESEFKEKVVDYFLDGHREGTTPNPCVSCNKNIKFGAMFEKMKELDCDFLATGHYANIKKSKGELTLHRGRDGSKDQSYFLYNLSQNKLKHLLFPLGDFTKAETRALAKKYALTELEGKRESQGVCFYPEATYKPFLERYLKTGKDFKGGHILDAAGEKLGEHDGLPFYTIGQRKGIKIGGGPALYVNKIDKIKNALIVGSEYELESSRLKITEANFINGKTPSSKDIFDIRVRNHGKFTRGRIFKDGKNFRVELLAPERAIMPGQSLVLYRGTEVVGGGLIIV